jgi:hypothetical protein
MKRAVRVGMVAALALTSAASSALAMSLPTWRGSSRKTAPVSVETVCRSCEEPGHGPAVAPEAVGHDSRPALLGSISRIMAEVEMAIGVLVLRDYVNCSWTEIKLCYKYPPGHPLRPACCDDHSPKDPVPPPGG